MKGRTYKQTTMQVMKIMLQADFKALFRVSDLTKIHESSSRL